MSLPQERSNARTIAASALMVILLSSFVVIMGGMSRVEAQEGNTSDVSAASGSNRFVVWQDSAGTGPGDIYFKRSTDNGATWKASVNLSNNPGGSFNPKIAVSGSNVYVVWDQVRSDGTSRDIFLKRSTDNGATWKVATKITPGGTCPTTTNCHVIDSLAASGSSVYLTTQFSGDIFIRRSSDNGATWKTPTNLSSNAGSSINSDISVWGTNVYLTWQQESVDHLSVDIFVRRSTDSGATWKSKVNLSKDPGYSENPKITSQGSNVYVIWDGDVTYPDERTYLGILFKRSTDNGATWSAVQTLSESPTLEPSDGRLVGAIEPLIVSVGTNVYAAWKDNVVTADKDGNADIFFRRSLDGGSSWDTVVNIGHASNNDNVGGCIPVSLGASNSNVYLAWASSAACGDNETVAFSKSNDNGATWSPPKNMVDVFLRNAGAHTPIEIAATGNTVFVVITRTMSGPGSDIFVGRSTDSGQTWDAGLNLSKLSGSSRLPQMAL